jgi:hypothetical protein
VSSMERNRCPPSIGITVQHAPESVSSIRRITHSVVSFLLRVSRPLGGMCTIGSKFITVD